MQRPDIGLSLQIIIVSVQRWLWYPIYTPIEYQSGYVSNLLKDNFTDYPSGDIAMTEIGLKYRAEVLPRETHVSDGRVTPLQSQPTIIMPF